MKGTIAAAPDDPGIYALFAGEQPVYYGWEISSDPPIRLRQLLEEHKALFRTLPRYNRSEKGPSLGGR